MKYQGQSPMKSIKELDFEFFKSFRFGKLHTVWKFHEFCVIQILHEINFDDS